MIRPLSGNFHAHSLVTSNLLEFSVDQEFDQPVCWPLPLPPLAWLMPPQSTPPPWSTTLTSQGRTPILSVLCRLCWARVYIDHIIDSYFSWHSWYKSYVGMVGKGGQKDCHHSLSTSRNLLHLRHKIHQYYHNHLDHQYQWEHYSLPFFQSPTIPSFWKTSRWPYRREWVTPRYLFVLRGVQIVPGVFLISLSTFGDFGYFWFILVFNFSIKMIVLDENCAFTAISLSMAS